jgi:rhodanese-related sulfurtransferase
MRGGGASPRAPGRRALLLGGAAALLVGAAALAPGGRNLLYAALTEETQAREASAAEAHAMAGRGEALLVDIRRPEEWAATGTGEGAVRLDMRREDFSDRLLKLAGSRDMPVALICARGVRSAHMANRLAEAGFRTIIDVPEGMLGSAAGPGWIASGLPLDRR